MAQETPDPVSRWVRLMMRTSDRVIEAWQSRLTPPASPQVVRLGGQRGNLLVRAGCRIAGREGLCVLSGGMALAITEMANLAAFTPGYMKKLLFATYEFERSHEKPLGWLRDYRMAAGRDGRAQWTPYLRTVCHSQRSLAARYLFAACSAWVTLHEIGHLVLSHHQVVGDTLLFETDDADENRGRLPPIGTRHALELQADMFATGWLIEWAESELGLGGELLTYDPNWPPDVPDHEQAKYQLELSTRLGVPIPGMPVLNDSDTRRRLLAAVPFLLAVIFSGDRDPSHWNTTHPSPVARLQLAKAVIEECYGTPYTEIFPNRYDFPAWTGETALVHMVEQETEEIGVGDPAGEGDQLAHELDELERTHGNMSAYMARFVGPATHE